MKVSDYPGNFETTLSGNLSSRKVSGSFKGVLGEDEFKGQFYISNQGLILTRETVESLYAIDALDEDMIGPNDIDDLPQYIVYPAEGNDMATATDFILEALESSTDKSDKVIALYEELLKVIPSSCYSYANGNPVLRVDLDTFASQEFINSLKEHGDSIIDNFLAISETSSTDKSFNEEMAKDMKDSIAELTPEMVKEGFREIPITIKKFEIICKSDKVEESIDISIDDNGDKCSITCQGLSQVSSGQSSVDLAMQINMDVTDTKVNSDLKMNCTSDFRKLNCNLSISANGKMEEADFKGKANGVLNMDWSSKTPVSLPTLTSQNSKVIKPAPPKSSNEGISVVIDGEDIDFGHVKPIIVNGRTMLPLRELVEYLGCEVEWRAPSTIKINDYDNSIIMNVNSKKYLEGNAAKEMDVAPMIVDGHTYVPVRFIAEYFGYEVQWDPESQTVYLYY